MMQGYGAAYTAKYPKLSDFCLKNLIDTQKLKIGRKLAIICITNFEI
jgi:hypothetical protein